MASSDSGGGGGGGGDGAGAPAVHAPLKGIAAGDLGAHAGAGMRFGIVRTQWNKEVIDALVAGARRALAAHGVAATDIFEETVPGAFELPLGARLLLGSPLFGGVSRHDVTRLDAVICIGCLIKGETMHFEYICEGVSQGIMRLNADLHTPVIFGVLAVLTEEQARARAGLGPGSHNHGEEWAQSAIKMVQLKRKLRVV